MGLCGEAALAKRGVLGLRFPMERGVVVNWPNMERMWRHVFLEGLQSKPDEPALVVVAEAPLAPKAQREKQAQQLEHQAPPHATAMGPRSGGQRPPQLAAPARGPVGKLPAWGWQQPVPWMMQAAAPSWW